MQVELKLLGSIATLTLNRPESANAFNETVVSEITTHLKTLAANSKIRLVILQGAGKNFCAGADLAWMKELGAATEKENLASSQKMAAMFYELFKLPMPTIAVVKGSAFGGALGLISCCDFAIAAESAKFCLSEVKWGLLPAVILPYLQLKMSPISLNRLGFSARIFSAAEAKEAGLIALTTAPESLAETVEAEVAQLMLAAPEAQRRLKLLNQLNAGHLANALPYCQAISSARASAEGQAGLSAFVNRGTAPWQTVLDRGWFNTHE